jgi:6-phosphogluconolactonase/glucosamine-6-phosphate isomerase/deaminase
MKGIEDAALRVQKELALEHRTLAATGEGSFAKNTGEAVDLAWHAKAVGIVENLRTFTQDEELMSRLGLAGHTKLRIAIQSLGYLAAEIIDYLKELQESGEALNFEIVGVSGGYGGVYEPKGIPMERLVTLKDRYRETTARHQESNVRKEYQRLTGSPALPLGPLNDFFKENFEADIIIATSPVTPIILRENLEEMKKKGVKILLQGGAAPQAGEADPVQTLENTSSPFLYLPYALVGGGDVYTASEEYFHLPMQRGVTPQESRDFYLHIAGGVRELAFTNAQWMLQQLKDANFERSPAVILDQAVRQIRSEKDKLLKGPPVLVEQRAELDFQRGVRRKFALRSAAGESARERVIYKNDNVFALRMELNQKIHGQRGRNRKMLIARQRRAAYIMGKLRKRDAVPDLVEMLRDRGQDPQVRANAAEALGNIGDWIASRGVLEQRANDPREHPQVRVWANWALRKLAAIGRVGTVTEKTPKVDISEDQLDSQTGEVLVRGYEVMSRKVAQRVLQVVKEKKKTGKPALIMLPTGSTPEGFYKVLREKAAEKGEGGGVDFSDVILFHLDEYIFDQDRFYDDAGKLKSAFQEQTYKHFMETHVVDPLKKSAGLTRFYTPLEHPEVLRRKADESEAAYLGRAEQAAQDYENKLTRAMKEAGGIDLVVLGIGGGYMEGGAIQGGHIAFNESGEQSHRRSKARVAKLSGKTRLDAQGRFGGLHATPHYAVTVGMKRILEAKEILMLGSGEDKAAVVEEALNGEISSNFPASFLRLHEKVTYYLDRDAAVALPEMTKPWLFSDEDPKNRDWADLKLVSKAVYYLLQVRRKSLGKLQRSDFVQKSI